MKIFTIFLSSILNFQLLDSPGNTTDTLTIHSITFSTASPEGWNAHYKTIAPSLIQMINGQRFPWCKH